MTTVVNYNAAGGGSGTNAGNIINNIITNNNYTATGNGLLTGGGVVWTGLYNYTISAATYQIAGATYSSAQTAVTLAAADPSLDRIDIIAVNTSGVPVLIQGTPSATPAAPFVDPTSQLELTFVYVVAGSTAPAAAANENVYLENTEWTGTAVGAGFNLASTNNPFQGTKDIEATAVITGNTVTYVKPAAGTIDPGAYNTLVFYIRSKAAWPSTKQLVVTLLNGTNQVGQAVAFTNGSFGFNSSVVGAYQQIVVPITVFQSAGRPITTIRLSVLGAGGSIGFYLDYWFFQSGVTQQTLGAPMVYKGTWIASASYGANDVVTTGSGASAASYVALSANTNQNPATATTIWQPLSAVGAGTGSVTSVAASGGVQTTSGSAITTTGTIQAAHVIQNQTGTTYAIAAADRGRRINLTNAAAIALTLAQAGTTGFENGWFTFIDVNGAGGAILTPTTSTINGASTLLIDSGMAAIVISDGTDYRAFVWDRAGVAVNAQTGTTYTYLSGDRNKLVTHTNGSAIAATLPQATTVFGSSWCMWVQNRGAGTLTITPTTSTIDGAATLVLLTGQGALITSDGTNYFTMRGMAGLGLSIASGKTLTVSNSITLAGTDSTTMTFPPASASIGYLGIPQNSQSVNYTTVLADNGKHLLHPAADTNARTFTIDSNANVAYPIGAAITFVNQTANVLSIAITSDTMTLANSTTTGTRSLAQNGAATAVKVSTTGWIIYGVGLT